MPYITHPSRVLRYYEKSFGFANNDAGYDDTIDAIGRHIIAIREPRRAVVDGE